MSLVGCSLSDPSLNWKAPTVVSAGAQDLLFRLGQKNKQAFSVTMTMARGVQGKGSGEIACTGADHGIWIRRPLDRLQDGQGLGKGVG